MNPPRVVRRWQRDLLVHTNKNGERFAVAVVRYASIFRSTCAVIQQAAHANDFLTHIFNKSRDKASSPRRPEVCTCRRPACRSDPACWPARTLIALLLSPGRYRSSCLLVFIKFRKVWIVCVVICSRRGGVGARGRQGREFLMKFSPGENTRVVRR